MGKLTAIETEAMTEPGWYCDCDCDGLYRNVALPGSKSWVKRNVFDGLLAGASD